VTDSKASEAIERLRKAVWDWEDAHPGDLYFYPEKPEAIISLADASRIVFLVDGLRATSAEASKKWAKRAMAFDEDEAMLKAEIAELRRRLEAERAACEFACLEIAEKHRKRLNEMVMEAQSMEPAHSPFALSEAKQYVAISCADAIRKRGKE